MAAVEWTNASLAHQSRGRGAEGDSHQKLRAALSIGEIPRAGRRSRSRRVHSTDLLSKKLPPVSHFHSSHFHTLTMHAGKAMCWSCWTPSSRSSNLKVPLTTPHSTLHASRPAPPRRARTRRGRPCAGGARHCQAAHRCLGRLHPRPHQPRKRGRREAGAKLAGPWRGGGRLHLHLCEQRSGSSAVALRSFAARWAFHAAMIGPMPLVSIHSSWMDLRQVDALEAAGWT
eukprot:365741-Chlamydomonas_euryale.AAC.3